jgi:hypothetical protein
LYPAGTYTSLDLIFYVTSGAIVMNRTLNDGAQTVIYNDNTIVDEALSFTMTGSYTFPVSWVFDPHYLNTLVTFAGLVATLASIT